MLPLLALISGILFVSTLSALPPFSWWFAIAPLLFLFVPVSSSHLRRVFRLASFFALGSCWGLHAGHYLLKQQLPLALEGEEIVVQGDIIDLPEQRGLNQRFLFQVDDAATLQQHSSTTVSQTTVSHAPKRILITWYNTATEPQQLMQVGQRWQFVVKLKRPRALVNEGGFDYQRWLLSQKIGATGYIRQSSLNKPLPNKHNYPIQEFRQHLRQWLSSTANDQSRGPLLALAIGDNSLITAEQWQLFRATGTGHLMAISGLHIGLIAVFGFFLGRLLCTGLAVVDRQWSFASYLPSIFSCSFALGYSALAGFGLPTQRALIMVLLFNLAILCRRGHQPLRALATAALIVLMIDPLAGWELGFWLSFAAVAGLLGYFLFRRRSASTTIENSSNENPSIFSTIVAHRNRFGMANKFFNLVRAQGIVFVGLFLPLLVFNTPLSLLAPFANLIVIPAVSFFVVIPLLVAVVLQTIHLGVANALIEFASWSLQTCFSYLALLEDSSSQSQWFPSDSVANWPFLLCALVGVLILMQGKGFPGRWLAGLLILPALLPIQEKSPPLSVSVLDVGQGLAIVVQTPDHALLYDAGASFSENFNIGEAVVLPFLRQQGISHLDTVIISHGDNDHAGGLKPIINAIDVDRLIVGEVLPQIPQPFDTCDKDEMWQWQGVEFRLIEPQLAINVRDNNNLSCILLLSFADQHVLLPGDIEASVERILIDNHRLPVPTSVVVAPHHGSRTSSTPSFVQTVKANHVIFSAAFGSRYGHPHPQVTQRYQQNGSNLYNTAELGQIKMVWSESGKLVIQSLRQHKPRYWY